MYAVRQNLGFFALRHYAHTLGNTLVGKKHEFLDKFIGILLNLYVCGHGVPLLVNLETHFGTVESNGTVGKTLLAQQFCKAVERYELFGKFADRLVRFHNLRVATGKRKVFGRSLAVFL